MPEQIIESHIKETLAGDKRENALDFVAHLKANEMQFERGKGYWEDKLYWMVKYKGEYVCFILFSSDEDGNWIIWSDDSGSDWYANAPMDASMKEIAWKHVDICGNCGGCKNPGGSRKTIFGKEFDNVCVTPMKFDSPDSETVECMKKMIEIRKTDIICNTTKRL
ncbi:MAG: hypothetical protein FWG69_03470 [Oscillospiraceae bacterium]|nr:hypothetical protein [Oscillospiraceae bacterium]